MQTFLMNVIIRIIMVDIKTFKAQICDATLLKFFDSESLILVKS